MAAVAVVVVGVVVAAALSSPAGRRLASASSCGRRSRSSSRDVPLRRPVPGGVVRHRVVVVGLARLVREVLGPPQRAWDGIALRGPGGGVAAARRGGGGGGGGGGGQRALAFRGGVASGPAAPEAAPVDAASVFLLRCVVDFFSGGWGGREWGKPSRERGRESERLLSSSKVLDPLGAKKRKSFADNAPFN